MTNFVLIDGSYYIFYRYHALLSWYRFSHPNDDLTHPEANEEFVEKFKKTFISSIEDIIKTLKIDNPVIIIGKDCPRKDIWRKQLYSEYKSQRDYTGWTGCKVLEYAHNILLKDLCKQYKIPYTIIRPSAVYGPTDNNNRVLGLFLTNAINKIQFI